MMAAFMPGHDAQNSATTEPVRKAIERACQNAKGTKAIAQEWGIEEKVVRMLVERLFGGKTTMDIRKSLPELPPQEGQLPKPMLEAMIRLGASKEQIAERFGVTIGIVAYWVTRYWQSSLSLLHERWLDESYCRAAMALAGESAMTPELDLKLREAVEERRMTERLAAATVVA
jgi:transposase-like protein